MNALPIADQHRLRAAEGWLELGNAEEATAELQQVDPAILTHPDVLNLRWQICRKIKRWESCWELARTFTQTAPKDPRGWTSLAQTLYHTQRVQEAYDLAVSKMSQFPKYWPLYYDAACYACLTGRLQQARQFLQLATAFGEEAEIRRLAAQDPDLTALRHEFE
jgi:predicted Zn-dependent protease